MKLLFVNHTGCVSGGEYSLLELARALDSEDVELLCPDGALVELALAAGLRRHVIAGADGSLRLHPWRTPRAVAQMLRASDQVRRRARISGPDIVHANSIRAGLIACGAAAAGSPRPVVHARDVLPSGPISTATLAVLDHRAAAIIANSEYTAASMRSSLRRAPVHVLHNAVDAARFAPSRFDRARARARLDLSDGQVTAAVIAQLTPWKAQDDAIRAVAGLAQSDPELRLLLIGGVQFASGATRYDNVAFERMLRGLIRELGMQSRTSMLGHRDDVPELLAAVDILLVPSWEEPFGRSVLEAMAMEVPVIATNVGGPAEILRDGHDGLLLAPRDPENWGNAIAWLARNPRLRERMGANGRARAIASFGVAAQIAILRRIYAAIAPD
jgi:L-malate glycosyltransferase